MRGKPVQQLTIKSLHVYFVKKQFGAQSKALLKSKYIMSSGGSRGVGGWGHALPMFAKYFKKSPKRLKFTKQILGTNPQNPGGTLSSDSGSATDVCLI